MGKIQSVAAAIAALTLSAAAFARAGGFGTVASGSPEKTGDALYEGFRNPPKSARPRVWWHWMNGNITKDGIRKDLLWMHGAGIVGFHNFDAGVVICGSMPKRLAGNAGTEEEFEALVNDVWNSGRGNVTAGVGASKVFSGIGLEPDLSILSGDPKNLRFVHRILPDGEIYWLANLSDETKDITASFRTSGRRPVVWNAENASAGPVGYGFSDGRTDVRMKLTPYQALFVILAEDTDVRAVNLPETVDETMLEIATPWTVGFQPERGASESATSDRLVSLTESKEAGIRYFSGAATYSNIFRFDRKSGKGKAAVFLDLGDVKDLAEVTVNGKNLGVFWNAPFKVDITDALRYGKNTVEIKVVNMWHNRLVGDVQPGMTEKVTYTQMEFFKQDEPLLPAGLIGPVRLIGRSIIK